MRYLQQQPRELWTRPYFDTLGGECQGLGELRLPWMNVQYRPIGFASGEMEYTWLFVAEERNGNFVPRNTCTICQARKNDVLQCEQRACVCDFE
jgi:hypothetical protein